MIYLNIIPVTKQIVSHYYWHDKSKHIEGEFLDNFGNITFVINKKKIKKTKTQTTTTLYGINIKESK